MIEYKAAIHYIYSCCVKLNRFVAWEKRLKACHNSLLSAILSRSGGQVFVYLTEDVPQFHSALYIHIVVIQLF